MTLSYISVLIICGTWLYATSHRSEGLVMYVVAFVLWVVTVATMRGMP